VYPVKQDCLSPDYTVGIHGQSTWGRDEPIHNLLEDQNILGSSRRPIPTPRGSEGRPPSSPRRSTPSVARPPQGSPHSKSHPRQSNRTIPVYNQSSRIPIFSTTPWEIQGLINHRWRKESAFFKKPQLYCKDPWAINSRKRWTYPQPTGGPDHPWIFKKTRPHSQAIRGSTTIIASLQHTKCGKALIEQSTLKIIS
jgi:hypothetical protein